MELCAFRPEDLPKMAELFYETVHTVNAADYPPEALDAWADGKPPLEQWEASFRAHETLLAWEGERLLGFADMDSSGYLDRLYVNVTAQRRGVATALLKALEARVPTDRYTTHASITAVPFFQARGFRVVRQQQVERHGVKMVNFVREKP